MDLKDGNNEDIVPTYTKGSLWLKICGCSNTLTACLTRLITNHAPIGIYKLRFFLKEPYNCPCKKAEIETRQPLLFNCKRFKKSWNPKREPIFDILTFLEPQPRGIFLSRRYQIVYPLISSVTYNLSNQNTSYRYLSSLSFFFFI